MDKIGFNDGQAERETIAGRNMAEMESSIARDRFMAADEEMLVALAIRKNTPSSI